MSAQRQVVLPEELCLAAERKFASQFENLEALVEFVLRELVEDKAEALDRAEQELLEQRLRDLGYV